MEPEFDPVYRRTRAGKQQAVSGAFELSSDGSRLLLLVNGLTAASGLAHHLAAPVRVAAEELVLHGLIEASTSRNAERMLQGRVAASALAMTDAGV